MVRHIHCKQNDLSYHRPLLIIILESLLLVIEIAAGYWSLFGIILLAIFNWMVTNNIQNILSSKNWLTNF